MIVGKYKATEVQAAWRDEKRKDGIYDQYLEQQKKYVSHTTEWQTKLTTMLEEAGRNEKSYSVLHELKPEGHKSLRTFMPLMKRKMDSIESLLYSETYNQCPGGPVVPEKTLVVHYLHNSNHFALVTSAFYTSAGLVRFVYDDQFDQHTGKSRLMTQAECIKWLKSGHWKVYKSEATSGPEVTNCNHCLLVDWQAQHDNWRDLLADCRVCLGWCREFEHQPLEHDQEKDNNFDSYSRHIMTCAPDTALVGRYLLGLVGVSTLDPWNLHAQGQVSTFQDQDYWNLTSIRDMFIHYIVGARLNDVLSWWGRYQDTNDRRGVWDLDSCHRVLDAVVTNKQLETTLQRQTTKAD